MTYRSSWSFVAPHWFFANIRVLHLVNFTDGTVFQTFFYTIADIVLIFWHVSQSLAFLKAMHTDRHISFILKDDQIPSLTTKKDIIPPGTHAAGRGLGIAMQYFQNACST